MLDWRLNRASRANSSAASCNQRGEPRWLWASGKVIRDDQGRAVHFVGSSQDVTARKVAERRLQTQLERLNLLGQIPPAPAALTLGGTHPWPKRDRGIWTYLSLHQEAQKGAGGKHFCAE